MSKRGGFPGGTNFGGMNLNKLMKEAKKMQADMEKSQEELQAMEFEATAGGGAQRRFPAEAPPGALRPGRRNLGGERVWQTPQFSPDLTSLTGIKAITQPQTLTPL